MKNKVNITAHSLSPQGDELITVLATFPRINTHRMLSKNTSSSRAIPFKKMVESVQNNPFIPIAWQKEHTGMQGFEYFQEGEYEAKERAWLRARDKAIEREAQQLDSLKVTKQLCNRLLEPFMWTTMLITGSREGWNNFFKLRCPSYSGLIMMIMKKNILNILKVKKNGWDNKMLTIHMYQQSYNGYK